MAIARISTGEVYADYSDINKIVGPVQVGRFSLSEEVGQKISNLSMPLTKEGADYIFANFDPDAENIMKNEGFDFAIRKLGCYAPPVTRGGNCSFSRLDEGSGEIVTDEMNEAGLTAYLTPHNIHVNDWHFTLSGTIVKGIQLKGDKQAVVYVTPGEWIRLAPTVLNWPIFAFGVPVIGISYYDREVNSEGWFDMDLHPDHPILLSTKF